MYVIAKHRITNPEKFVSLAASAAEDAPAGVFGRQFCPSRDGSEAVCLWEADLLDSVRALTSTSCPWVRLRIRTSRSAWSTRLAFRSRSRRRPDEHRRGRSSFKTYRGTAAENYERYFVPSIGASLASPGLSRTSSRRWRRRSADTWVRRPQASFGSSSGCTTRRRSATYSTAPASRTSRYRRRSSGCSFCLRPSSSGSTSTARRWRRPHPRSKKEHASSSSERWSRRGSQPFTDDDNLTLDVRMTVAQGTRP